MNGAVEMIRSYMKHGVVDESTLTPLFARLFELFPVPLEDQMNLFIDITGMKNTYEYANTWNDLEFTVVDDYVPFHPRLNPLGFANTA